MRFKRRARGRNRDPSAAESSGSSFLDLAHMVRSYWPLRRGVVGRILLVGHERELGFPGCHWLVSWNADAGWNLDHISQ